MQLVFDLDECLVATRAAHAAAFLSVGIVMPSEGDDYYRPARFWLRDDGAYARKHAAFPLMLAEHGRLLPAMRLLGPGSVILTGTSDRSLEAVHCEWPELGQYETHCGMGPEEKMVWLRARAPGIYFDDWSSFVLRVREETLWQAVDVSGL